MDAPEKRGSEEVQLINLGRIFNECQSCNWNQLSMSSQETFLQPHSASPSPHFDNDNN